jgi:dipeptidyl aminopeptidase/acylaminoacyl peptidase
MQAEFGSPQWVFGLSRYAHLPDGTVACIYTEAGTDHLGLIRPDAGSVERLDLPFLSFSPPCLQADAETGRLAFIAASATEPPSVVTYDLQKRALETVRRSVDRPVDQGYISQPRPIEFPTAEGLTAHALFYPPSNRDFVGPGNEKPPLIVMSHGGPTSRAGAELNLGIQFWTSRGFAVVDVNYGGSTGYGREYRERLKGQWGVVDVQDCVAAARFLAQEGEVDRQRLAIRGGSAGGYTTLRALTTSTDFSAGASYFGVADSAALARDTHNFE